MEISDAQHFVIENGRRSIQAFLEPLQRAPGIQSDQLGVFEISSQKYSFPASLPRARNSSDPIRIGIFAAIHGDEPAGALAASEFLLGLVNAAEIAENFLLQVYPIATPQVSKITPRVRGAAATSTANSGEVPSNLKLKFSSTNSAPAISMASFNYSLMIQARAFTDLFRGHTLTENLPSPCAHGGWQNFCPETINAIIDGFAGPPMASFTTITRELLAAPTRIDPVPFEIILETPHHATNGLAD